MATRCDARHRAIAIAGDAAVLWIRLPLAMERLGVAVDAGHVRVILLVDMAVGAYRALVWQLPISVVIESSSKPARRGVAGRASRREAGGDMIWHVAAKRYRALPCRDVAAVAVHG